MDQIKLSETGLYPHLPPRSCLGVENPPALGTEVCAAVRDRPCLLHVNVVRMGFYRAILQMSEVRDAPLYLL